MNLALAKEEALKLHQQIQRQGRHLYDTGVRLNIMEAIHGVLTKEVEDDLAALDHVLEGKRATDSEFGDEWIRGCRSGMAMALDIISGKLQGVKVDPDFPERPIRIRYYETVTESEKHVLDESLISEAEEDHAETP